MHGISPVMSSSFPATETFCLFGLILDKGQSVYEITFNVIDNKITVITVICTHDNPATVLNTFYQNKVHQ
jgi:hypothetical protein